MIEAPANRPSPCVNGYCIDGINSYFCQCFDGFTGPNCDQTGIICNICDIRYSIISTLYTNMC